MGTLLFSLDGCDSCALRRTWPSLTTPKMPVIPPEQPSEARILVIGEAPGETEDKEGKPFMGKSGKFLREYLPMGWAEKVYWSSIVRCRPPNNKAPTTADVLCCSTYLEEDLEKIKPHAILLLGSVALDYFWPGASVTLARGMTFPIQLSSGWKVWCYCTFHPSYVSRGTRKDYSSKSDSTPAGLFEPRQDTPSRDESRNTLLPIFKSDLKKFFDRVPEFLSPPAMPTPPRGQVLFPKSLGEFKIFFNQLEEPYGVDFETSKLKPYQRDARMLCAAFSDGKLTFAAPVKWNNQLHTWGVEAVDWAFKQKKRWIAHNAGFELAWIWYNCDEFDQQFEDSMGKARMYHERETTLSLANQSFAHLGINIKKLTRVSEDVLNLTNYPMEEGLEYCAFDAWACWALNFCYPLTAKQQSNYARSLDSIRSTTAMELWGLNVDLKKTAELKLSLAGKKEEFQAKAREIAEVQKFEEIHRKTFSLSSNDDVGITLVKFCGLELPPTPSTKNNADSLKKYSTDENDLKKYVGHPIVDLRLDFKEVDKLLSTYINPMLNGDLVGVDGLLHPSYTTLLTATGRLSSNNPNIQNFPVRKNKEVREQVVAPPGYVLVSADYGQLEARTLCFATKDKLLRQSFINHEDIHQKWLDRLLQIYPRYIDKLARDSGETDHKKLLKVGRTAIKTDLVFASFYGSQPKSVSANTGIPYAICFDLLEEFWSNYPEVKEWLVRQQAIYQETGQVETLTGMVRNEQLPGNEFINTPIQGTGAHIVLEAQNAIFYRAIREDINLLPRIQIHDDVEFYFPNDERLEGYIKIMGEELVKPRFDFINCPLVVEYKMGPDWGSLEEAGKFEGEFFQ